MSVKTFDPKRVAISLNGLPLTGFAEGSLLSVEFDEDAYVKSVGSTGEVARTKTNNYTGQITFSLQYTSTANQILMNMAKLDRDSNDGIATILIEDGSGASALYCDSAWVMKAPDLELNNDNAALEWILDCGQIEFEFNGIA
jgi:hypothetical protein